MSGGVDGEEGTLGMLLVEYLELDGTLRCENSLDLDEDKREMKSGMADEVLRARGGKDGRQGDDDLCVSDVRNSPGLCTVIVSLASRCRSDEEAEDSQTGGWLEWLE
jgi:hypothetical protein